MAGTQLNSTGVTFPDATAQTTARTTSNTVTSFNGSTGAVSYTAVTSAVAGTGIGVSAATGAVTFTNNGVTSAVAGNGVSVSAATGAVTFAAAAPTALSVGSYAFGNSPSPSGTTGSASSLGVGGASGTWRVMGNYTGFLVSPCNTGYINLCVRVS